MAYSPRSARASSRVADTFSSAAQRGDIRPDPAFARAQLPLGVLTFCPCGSAALCPSRPEEPARKDADLLGLDVGRLAERDPDLRGVRRQTERTEGAGVQIAFG